MRRFAAATAALAGLLGLLYAPANAEQTTPVVTPLPAGAVTLQACSWKAKSTAFDADVRIANHTNLPVDKVRLQLTFIDTSGEVVKAYADMKDSNVSLVRGMPMDGRWTHGTFPLSLKAMRCSLVGVKFQGYPNVIFSALK